MMYQFNKSLIVLGMSFKNMNKCLKYFRLQIIIICYYFMTFSKEICVYLEEHFSFNLWNMLKTHSSADI